MQSPTAFREQLACALRVTSPTYVISQGWDRLFKDFFARGTIHETQQLLPNEYILTTRSSSTSGPASASPCSSIDCPLGPVEDPITTPAAAVERNNVQIPVSIPRHNMNGSICISSSQIQKPVSLSNARIITPVCYPLSKSLHKPSEKASRAIQAMRDAKRHDHAFYDSIWIGMQEVCVDQGVEEIALNRYGRIQALQSRNEARGDIFKYAQRLSLLLGAHELQVIERTLPPEACTRGISLRSVAINMLAKHLHVERRCILDDNKRRSHYVSICERFGPGALLLLGESDGILSLWERDLNTEDVESICKYATYHLRDWVKDCENLNEKAGFLITEGLRSCGWDGHSNRDTTLMKCLADSVNLGSLHSVPATQEEANSRKRKNSEEEALSKRHCHDKVPILSDRTTSLPIEPSSGEQSVHSETRFGGSHPELPQEGVNATLDWDCSIHLDLDWDQFIDDQIIESMNG